MTDNYGIVYVLSNPAMPGIVKIGLTNRDSIEIRMKELYSTGVPVPFECECAYKVENCETVEKALHIAFDPYRVNQNREFFSIQPYQAKVLLELFNKEDITSQVNKEIEEELTIEDKESSRKIHSKRPIFTFSRLGIRQGELIHFIRNKNITAEVVSDRKVLFNGEIRSLSPITVELLNQPITLPSLYWEYNGKKLRDIYDEVYSFDE